MFRVGSGSRARSIMAKEIFKERTGSLRHVWYPI